MSLCIAAAFMYNICIIGLVPRKKKKNKKTMQCSSTISSTVVMYFLSSRLISHKWGLNVKFNPS